MATLPGAWRYSVSAGTGWPGVSILWLGEMKVWSATSVSEWQHLKLSRYVPEIHWHVAGTLSIQSNARYEVQLAGKMDKCMHRRTHTRNSYSSKLANVWVQACRKALCLFCLVLFFHLFIRLFFVCFQIIEITLFFLSTVHNKIGLKVIRPVWGRILNFFQISWDLGENGNAKLLNFS